MIIKTSRAIYRSIKNETLVWGNRTVLVGENGAGKSNFLKAPELFFASSVKSVAEADYHAGKVANLIEVELTFGDLDERALRDFGLYVWDGLLRVMRRFDEDGESKYYSWSKQHQPFAVIRKVPLAADRRAPYTELRQREGYTDLPAWVSFPKADQAMREWERSGRVKCEWSLDKWDTSGTNNEMSRLSRYIRFVPIPAVLDASDEAEDKGSSAVKELMDAILRAKLESHDGWQDLNADIGRRYDGIAGELLQTSGKELQNELTDVLQMYAPNSAVKFDLERGGPLSLRPPLARLSLTEDGHQTTVDRAGHGTQRSLIIALLGMLARTRAKATTDHLGPTLVFSIEEPEIFQHPARQRYIARALKELAKVDESLSTPRVQVVFATHSLHFLPTDRIDDVRVIRKKAMEGEPGRSIVASLNLGECAEKLGMSVETLHKDLRRRLPQSLNEGFFTGLVVLVEGDADQVVLEVVAERLGYDFDELDIRLIPCSGKPGIPKPFVIFSELKVPTYVIFDGDNDGLNGTDNEKLVRLLGLDDEAFEQIVTDKATCFPGKMEETLNSDWGEERFHQGVPKNREAYQSVVEKAYYDGKRSDTIERVVRRIVNLRLAHRGGG